MAQHDFNIANATFPSVRSDINSVLEAINTSNSGTSRPSSAVAGTIWLDTTSATTPTLKFYDGADDISLATLDYTANTVNWLDSTVVFDIVGDTTPQLGGDLDVNGNDIVSVSNGNITFTPNGSGKVVISGLSFPTSDGTADQVLKTDGSGNLSFADSFTGIDWQSITTASTLTTVAGNGYPINTTSNACTVTLPSSASAGDQVQIVDYAGTFATNNVRLTSSLKIEGGTSDKILTTNREGVILTYVDVTQGWVATTGVNSGDQALDPMPPYSVDFLVVAGGGAGSGASYGGAGGAGGYRTSTQTVSVGTEITVTVGDGGTGIVYAAARGGNGSDSSISGSGLTTITSAGGGAGGTDSAGNENGVSGGSGGGATGSGEGIRTGGSGNTPSTSPVQGYAGGNGYVGPPNYGGGGGGGASAVGVNGTSTAGGNGGDGTASSITGSSVTRAGGGGGGVVGAGTLGLGGSGGGGDAEGNAGTVNTGGGGGAVGGSGGKGVVILSFPDANYSGSITGSPTVATGVSGKTILTFTGSGSYTA